MQQSVGSLAYHPLAASETGLETSQRMARLESLHPVLGRLERLLHCGMSAPGRERSFLRLLGRPKSQRGVQDDGQEPEEIHGIAMALSIVLNVPSLKYALATELGRTRAMRDHMTVRIEASLCL